MSETERTKENVRLEKGSSFHEERTEQSPPRPVTTGLHRLHPAKDELRVKNHKTQEGGNPLYAGI